MAVQKYAIACEYARGVESLRVLSARAGRHVPIGPDCEREYGAGSGPCLIFEIVPPWTMPPPAPPRDIRYRFVYDDVGHLRLYQINGTEYCCADGTPGGSCVTSSPTCADGTPARLTWSQSNNSYSDRQTQTGNWPEGFWNPGCPYLASPPPSPQAPPPPLC